MIVKRHTYHKAKIPEIWLIDWEQEVVIVDYLRKKKYVELSASQGRVISQVLEGFWLDAAWLWQEPLPKRLRCLRQILKEIA